MLIPLFDANIDNDDDIAAAADCCSDSTTTDDNKDKDDETGNGNWNGGNIKYCNRCTQILYCLK